MKYIFVTLFLAQSAYAQFGFFPYVPRVEDHIQRAQKQIAEWEKTNPPHLASPHTADMQQLVDGLSGKIDSTVSDPRIADAKSLLKKSVSERAEFFTRLNQNPLTLKNNEMTDLAIIEMYDFLTYNECIELDKILAVQPRLSDWIVQFLIGEQLKGDPHAGYVLAHFTGWTPRQKDLLQSRLREIAKLLGASDPIDLAKIAANISSPNGTIQSHLSWLKGSAESAGNDFEFAQNARRPRGMVVDASNNYNDLAESFNYFHKEVYRFTQGYKLFAAINSTSLQDSCSKVLKGPQEFGLPPRPQPQTYIPFI